MIIKALVKPAYYQDSVALMWISRRVHACAGVHKAAVMMATPQNKDIMREAGLFTEAVARAGPGDMVIVVSAETEEAAAGALREAEQWLAKPVGEEKNSTTSSQYRHLAAGIRSLPGADVAVISVPGVYAAAESLKALKNGLHVFLFSDNVSLEDEIQLKRLAHQRGLLLMGPDCGTAFIGGVPLGFANAVRRGGIGIVGASGTGMQEVMCLVDRWGGGISHAFGTGSRDLSMGVGGITTLDALEILARDEQTKVVVLVSKPPAPQVAEKILRRVGGMGKPVVLCLLGNNNTTSQPGVYMARTLEDAARLAVVLERGEAPGTDTVEGSVPTLSLDITGGYLRGLFSGGTLAEEALLILRACIGRVYSNLPEGETLADPNFSKENTIVDMGSDEFTVGRPHPMIDFSYRLERFQREVADPRVSVILMDVVLGFGSHPDPAAELVPPISEAIKEARRTNRDLNIVLNVVGTDADPQDYTAQVTRLKAAGALVAPTNAQAARMAAKLLSSGRGRLELEVNKQ
ncbi:acyl-CoA synthetase FdrA [Moorellaceae bacterium AZ2]